MVLPREVAWHANLTQFQDPKCNGRIAGSCGQQRQTRRNNNFFEMAAPAAHCLVCHSTLKLDASLGEVKEDETLSDPVLACLDVSIAYCLHLRPRHFDNYRFCSVVKYFRLATRTVSVRFSRATFWR